MPGNLKGVGNKAEERAERLDALEADVLAGTVRAFPNEGIGTPVQE